MLPKLQVRQAWQYYLPSFEVFQDDKLLRNLALEEPPKESLQSLLPITSNASNITFNRNTLICFDRDLEVCHFAALHTAGSRTQTAPLG